MLTRAPASTTDLPIQYLKGIGPRRATALAAQGIRTVRDLLYYFPYDYLDLHNIRRIGDLKGMINNGEWVTVIGTVSSARMIGRLPRQRCVVHLSDGSGTVQLVFFQSLRYFKSAFPPGEKLAVSGKVTGYQRQPQFVHPSVDRIGQTGDEDDDHAAFLNTLGLVPKYGSSGELKDVRLHVKGLRRIIRSALDQYLPQVEEFLPQKIRDRQKLMPIRDALKSIHFPDAAETLAGARRRLKFDELFTMQLLLAVHRNRVRVDMPGFAFNIESTLARRLVDSLPFKLTRAQVHVINQIAADMKEPRPMNRLLQGDVGSGKTAVALVAMLIAIDNGFQAAFMAPTEILAEQHYATIADLLGGLPVTIRLLLGGQRSKLRKDVLGDVESGSAQMVIGTHALIQEGVKFSRLGLVVIDEQHRFGVSQRAALREKGVDGAAGGPRPDILVMTATPIPRTLSLTLYGDLDVSVIDELPAGRRPVRTVVRSQSELQSVYRFIRDEVRKGRQAYIVYPLIEESEKLDLKAATESYQRLKSEIFPDLRVGLLHGRMPAAEKDEIMSSFKRGELQILVSTTVIEVGIDVPNASVMVIEHAERFGLSQLHQLRGRVGRGAEQSTCILIAPGWMARPGRRWSSDPKMIGDEERYKAERRLGTMVTSTDGFKIAEIDLELRGPGDFFGTRQSGLPQLQISNLITDGEILTAARREALELVESDPHLRSTDHRALRNHFEGRMKEAFDRVQGG